MNYKESELASTVWQRCLSVTLSNPHPAAVNPSDPRPVPAAPQPFARFQEEQVVAMPGGRFVFMPAGECAVLFTPAAEFPMLDPLTGVATGQTMTHGALYALLYSLYLHTATQRDAAVLNA